MTSFSFDRNEFLSYAQFSIAANSDEDRFSAVMNHSNQGLESFASFGTFDGHMGVRQPEIFSTFASPENIYLSVTGILR